MITTEQIHWTEKKGWSELAAEPLRQTAQLVFAFGATKHFRTDTVLNEIHTFYPNAQIIGCSTAGEILGTQVFDDSMVVTAFHFEHTEIVGMHTFLSDTVDSYAAGKELALKLAQKEQLQHVFVLSDGIFVNGSQLVDGLNNHLPQGVAVTGGLAGDGARFEKTRVAVNGVSTQKVIAAIGFYGERLQIGYGSVGGWDPFGPERIVTKSEANVLYELDGQSALDLYKKYLGEYAKDLPSSGLLFPLSLRTENGQTGLVRTILAVDENTNSMTFAGNIPENAKTRFMKANFERLIDGAIEAAENVDSAITNSPECAILISCVGRKLVLQQRIEEEVEGVAEVLGPDTTITGFYSYGEIAPFIATGQCELHNQTMTITTFSEK